MGSCSCFFDNFEPFVGLCPFQNPGQVNRGCASFHRKRGITIQFPLVEGIQFSQSGRTVDDLTEAGVDVEHMLADWQLHAIGPPANRGCAAVASRISLRSMSWWNSWRGSAAAMTLLTPATPQRQVGQGGPRLVCYSSFNPACSCRAVKAWVFQRYRNTHRLPMSKVLVLGRHPLQVVNHYVITSDLGFG